MRALLNAPAYWMSRRTNRPAATAIRQGAWLAARPWLNRVRREALGLGPLPLGEPIGQLDRERQLVLYPFSPSVFPKPSGWGDWTEVTGYWFLDARVDPEPPDDLRAFVEAGPPPVCMGFATQLDPDPVATTRMMVEALRAAGRRGVLLRRPEALEGVELRDDVYALERVPHDWLFPRCQAVVHHAGAGTTADGPAHRRAVGGGSPQRRPVHVGTAAGGAAGQSASDSAPEAFARGARDRP